MKSLRLLLPLLVIFPAGVFATAFTSTQNGNWGTSSTWGGAGVPGAGDTVIVNTTVTVTSPTIIGDGSNLVVATVNIGGLIQVFGATLAMRGSSFLGGYNNGIIGLFLVLQSSNGIPGGLEFDCNSGKSPVMTFSYDTMMVSSGTASTHCFIRTKSGSAGNNGRFDTQGFSSLFADISYTDFSRIGDSSHVGFNETLATPWGIGPPGYTRSICRFAYCNIDSCSSVPYVAIGQTGDPFDLIVTHCVWTNSTGTYSSQFGTGSTSSVGVGETHLIDQCKWFGPVQTNFFEPINFTITNNYFDEYFGSGIGSPVWTAFDGNFIQKTISQETVTSGDVTNNFWFNNPPVDGTADGYFLVTNFTSATIHGNVFQHSGTYDGDFGIGLSEGSLNPRLFTMTNNLMIQSSSGASSGWIGAFATNTDSTYPILVEFDHNTAIVGSQDGTRTYGVAPAERPRAITEFRSNLFWRTGTTNYYAINSITTGVPPVLDAIVSTAITNNAYWGLGRVPPGNWNGTVGASTCTDNTAYNSPMSSTITPGAFDVIGGSITSAQTQGPKFVDPTVTFEKWDASLGGAGTIASSLARIQNDPTLTNSSLLPYIRAGFLPQNLAISTAAHDGTTIGAVQISTGSPSMATGTFTNATLRNAVLK